MLGKGVFYYICSFTIYLIVCLLFNFVLFMVSLVLFHRCLLYFCGIYKSIVFVFFIQVRKSRTYYLNQCYI